MSAPSSSSGLSEDQHVPVVRILQVLEWLNATCIEEEVQDDTAEHRDVLLQLVWLQEVAEDNERIQLLELEWLDASCTIDEDEEEAWNEWHGYDNDEDDDDDDDDWWQIGCYGQQHGLAYDSDAEYSLHGTIL